MKKNLIYIAVIAVGVAYSVITSNKQANSPAIAPVTSTASQSVQNSDNGNSANNTQNKQSLNTKLTPPANTTPTGKSVQLSPEGRCETVLSIFNNNQLNNKIQNVEQLSTTIRSLNKTGQLPSYYVSKKQAQNAGWSPGTYFNDIPALEGSMIGGDRFSNFEKRLPNGQWTEADLDYVGKKRNAKRLVFSKGEQYITVDHYESFQKVPTCQ